MRKRLGLLVTCFVLGIVFGGATQVLGPPPTACQLKINCNASPIWSYLGKTPAEDDIYVCVNTIVDFSVSTDANDYDTCIDDARTCLDGPIRYTWSGVTNTGAASASGSWSECGDYTVTCTMSDPGNIVLDKTETATWTVHVGAKLLGLSDMDYCVYCPGDVVFFHARVEPDTWPQCCDGLSWVFNGKTWTDQCSIMDEIPINQPGGSTLRVTVNDRCGNTASRDILIITGCTYTPPPVPDHCSDPVVTYVDIDQEPGGCTYGVTGSGEGWGPLFHICFDCEHHRWRTHTEGWGELPISIRIDANGNSPSKLDATYEFGNCDAARDVKQFLIFARSNGQEGDICNVTYVPVACVLVHELAHVVDTCNAMKLYTQIADAAINEQALTAMPPYCDLATAQNMLAAWTENVLNDMIRDFIKYGEDNKVWLEAWANLQMEPCLENLMGQVCAGIPECEYCTW